jgi:hypothetical protein
MPADLIRVQLEQDDYAASDLLAGAFCIDDPPPDLESVELSVLWQTEGKGDTDMGVIHHTAWEQKGGTLAGLANPEEFSVTLPRSPWSYDGQLVKIRWCVRVRARWGNSGEEVREAPFQLGPFADNPAS